MVTIIFESHSTSVDNEAGLASGHFDVVLSELGIRQAKELGERHRNTKLDAVFCSDQKRSFMTGEIAFLGRNIPIFKDKRLRECDYGDLTRHLSVEVDGKKGEHVNTPFPNGESYTQTTDNMKRFLREIAKNYAGKKIMVIGSRATQYALEYLVNKVDLKTAVTAPWRWQPGWVYILESI